MGDLTNVLSETGEIEEGQYINDAAKGRGISFLLGYAFN